MEEGQGEDIEHGLEGAGQTVCEVGQWAGLEGVVGVGRGMVAVGLVRMGVAQSILVAVWVEAAWVGAVRVVVGPCISLGLGRTDQVREGKSAGVEKEGEGQPSCFLALF